MDKEFLEIKRRNWPNEIKWKPPQYKRAPFGKSPEIAKGQDLKLEHEHAENLDEGTKNKSFGFNCIHYTVSESCGSLEVVVFNKTGQSAKV